MATITYSNNYLSASMPEKAASLHDSARGSPEPIDGFHKLVNDINDILGPCNGIDSAGIDIGELKYVMRDYKSVDSEWDKYAFADYSRAYTRNLVDNCNGKSNLLILVWSPGKGSPIHDHANAHCVMKILKGKLTETLYGFPCEGSDHSSGCTTHPSSLYPSTQHTCSGNGPLESGALQVKRSTTYHSDQVAYMSDRLGLHRIENPSTDEVAISLHLYTPPNAAKHGCHIFDGSTGKKSHMKMSHFYSQFGEKS